MTARRPAALALVLLGGLGAWASTTDGAPALAAGERSGEHGGPAGQSTPTPAAGTWCPTLGKLVSSPGGTPVELVAGVGSTQSTHAGARFPIRLAVTVTDAEGNPVSGVLVTFSAPVHGASGRFTIRSRAPHRHRLRVSHPHAAQVKTDVCGIAIAPPFTANRKPGGYVVKAMAKPARPVAFALVNEAG